MVHHAAGRITEHFESVTTALIRQGQLEALLVAARGASPAEPLPMPPTIQGVSPEAAADDSGRGRRQGGGGNVRDGAPPRGIQCPDGCECRNRASRAITHRADAIIVDLRCR